LASRVLHRKASEVHRTVRTYIRKIAVPGVRLIDMCETLEESVRKLISEKGLQVRPFLPSARRSTALAAIIIESLAYPVSG